MNDQRQSTTTHRPLDEATIEAVRRRIGIPNRRSRRALNEVSSSDSFRHFARACGDDNPLYSDPDYARRSSWESAIAPPLYPLAAGVMRPVQWTEAEEAEMSGGDPLAGIGQYMCGDRWIFLKPVRAGDLLLRSQCLFSAELRESRLAGGSGAMVSHRISWEAEDGSPFTFRFLDFWHAERERSRTSGKYLDIEPTRYSNDDIEEIDALYAAETIRGATPRHAADVKVGDRLGPIVKGPLSVTDIICWHIGIGMGEYGVSALKLGYQNRQRVPGFYQKNEFGYWDAAQRCHWDESWARQLGQPAPYDYGVMRTAWMAHLVTNWMGDDAWIWKLSSAVRKFNYLGDVHRITGEVREVDLSANSVTIDISGVNQRGDVTCDGQAVVLLPSPDGPVDLPEFRPEDVPEAATP